MMQRGTVEQASNVAMQSEDAIKYWTDASEGVTLSTGLGAGI